MEVFSGYIGTRVDFTDRKDAEEQLRAGTVAEMAAGSHIME